MYDRILNKLCKITGNVKISILLYNIIINILDIIFYIRYFIVLFGDDTIKNTNEISKKKSISSFEQHIIRKNEMNFELSIIIPMYNSQNTIQECINSILKQKTNFKYEVILINDGSTDSTLEVIKQYENNKNIKVISQDNNGIASARNKGLEIATGKYLMFVDSDDTLECNAIESLLSEAISNNIDIVEGNYYNVHDNKKIIGKPLWNKNFKINLECNPEFIYNIKGFPWGRVYNRKLWRDVKFPIGFDYEDTIIKFTIFRKAKTFSYVNNVVYDYIIRKKSITSVLRGSMKSLDTYYIVPYLIKINEDLNIKFDETFYRIILNQFGFLLYNRTKELDENTVNSILVEAKNLLLTIEKYSPKLNLKDKLLKNALLKGNKKRWILCCNNR